MKYELETIPVWDSFKADSECALCLLYKKAEEDYLKFFLGNSVMVPEMRVEVNKTGFCPDHFQKLLQKRSPHYLGLMTHTHAVEYGETLNKQLQKLEKLAAAGAAKAALPVKNKKLNQETEALIELIKENTEKCMICTRIENTMKRYAFTIVYMWKKDPEFRECYKSSKGFCLQHLNLILEMAMEFFNGKAMSEFLLETLEVQKRNMNRLEEEILYFTQKFSQENDDKPWGDTKDAHYRIIQKLTGKETEH